MGRGRDAAARRRVDIAALNDALADARAPARVHPLPTIDPAMLVEYDARAARAWRARPRFEDAGEDPRRRRIAWALIALAHLLLLLALAYAMRLEPAPLVEPEESVLEVTFADPEPPMTPVEAAPEEPVATVDTTRATPVPHNPTRPPPAAAPAPREQSMEVTWSEAEPEPPPIKLFNSDGSVRLSQDVLDAAGEKPAPDFQAPVPQEPEFMKHKRAISDERTRFEKYWAPDGENLGQKIVRKFPPAALILQGVNLPKCKARSIAEECESEPVPQQFDDIIPNDVSEDPGIPR